MKSESAEKFAVTEIVNRLFIHTDYQDWDKLKALVFANEVWFDMSSAGAGGASIMSADSICEAWKEGFKGVDAVHHQAGHYLIDIDGDKADVFAYAVANHFKENATKGKIRTFTGSYNIGLINTSIGWRINSFKYTLKFVDGNVLLE